VIAVFFSLGFFAAAFLAGFFAAAFAFFAMGYPRVGIIQPGRPPPDSLQRLLFFHEFATFQGFETKGLSADPHDLDAKALNGSPAAPPVHPPLGRNPSLARCGRVHAFASIFPRR
jgi:hypothetical protein